MTHSRSRLFGTDGARGIANADLTPRVALALGRAYGAWLRRNRGPGEVLLARDTRVSGPMLGAATAAGLCSAGVSVADVGILTTPALCLLVRRDAHPAGVVISASHNPPAFNGIKLINSDGSKVPEDAEREIEDLAFTDEDLAPRPTSSDIGTIRRDETASERYLDLLFETVGGDLSLAGLKVVLDCCHGATYEVAPAAFLRAGAEVEVLNADADGTAINVDCGSLHPEGLARKVLARGADLGVAFDGDGDRAVFVDDRGQIRDGDFGKYVLAANLKARGLLNPPLVVGTVMSNLGLELALRELGVELLRADVGDRYVMDLMKQTGALLGGEQSGHIILAETGVGDGVYTALRVCEVLARSGQRLSELCAPLRKVPQVLINLPVRDKHSWERNECVTSEVQKWRRRLADRGRILLRPSGTEPLVRVMTEAVDYRLAETAAQEIANVIAAEYGLSPAGDELE